jgi:hypothetical protein
MNLQGESLENWATSILVKSASILKLDEDNTIGSLVRHATNVMSALPLTNPIKGRAVGLCDGLVLPANYDTDWAANTLNDLALVLGLPAGKTLNDVPAHSTAVMAALAAVTAAQKPA